MRVLIISAHPDDEVIGAGGTIARHADKGDDIYWCVVTDAYSPPWSEDYLRIAKEQVYGVKEVLSIKEVFFCGFPTVKLNTVPYIDISTAIQKIVDKVKPEIVYTTPRNDINQDHRIVHDCTLVATRPFPGSTIKRLLSYEIGPTNRYGFSNGSSGFPPNIFVDISPYLEKKLEAMRCYKTELQEYPNPRSLEGLRLLARECGLGVGMEAAEAFRLIREIQSTDSED